MCQNNTLAITFQLKIGFETSFFSVKKKEEFYETCNYTITNTIQVKQKEEKQIKILGEDYIFLFIKTAAQARNL